MAVAAENNDAGAGGDGPHCFEDGLPFVEVAGPGVCAAEAPIACKGDGGDDEFPFHARRLGAGKEVEEGGELFGPEHGFLRGVGGERLGWGAVATCIH